MKVVECKNETDAKLKAGGALKTFFKDLDQTPLLFLSSGGSALNLLQDIERNMLGPHVTIGVLDERFSYDENINNFSQLAAIPFYVEALISGATFFDTRLTTEETLGTLAERMDKNLHNWVRTNKNKGGQIIVTMGIGEDGHTAGIMPFPEDQDRFQGLFEDEQHFAVGYTAGDRNMYPERVTVTNVFLRAHVDTCVVYAVGENKKFALENVLVKEGGLYVVPARIIRDMKYVQLFTV